MKILICIVGVYLSTVLFASSVSQAQNAVMLSRYTFSPNSKIIGKIVPKGSPGTMPEIKLSGSSARLFTIDHNNNLVAGSAFAAPDNNMWQEVVIESVTPQGTVRDTFRIVKDDFIRNQVIAHRGAWKNTGATENSLAALQHAVAMGCGGSEFDVHLSEDNVLVVNHDHNIQGKHIEKTAATELLKLKLPNGETLPTLDAYLREGTRQNKTKLILEIKPSSVSKARSLALAQKVVQLVQQHKAQGWIDYISFDYDILKKVLELDPYAKVSYLKGDVAPDKLAQDKFYGLDYQLKVIKNNENWIDEAHRNNLTVNVWTVNDPKQMDWLLSKKADFITTNEPELLLKKLRK